MNSASLPGCGEAVRPFHSFADCRATKVFVIGYAIAFDGVMVLAESENPVAVVRKWSRDSCEKPW